MSAICPRFVQNAWKKDLCSNCFKSKEEHIKAGAVKPKPQPLPIPLNAEPPKSIIKCVGKKQSKRKVSFPKEVSKVIGFGGEWSESDCSDSEETCTQITKEDPSAFEEDEDLQQITKTNTDFNTDNGNLLGEIVNGKKSTASLKLGATPKDSDGKKQTLKISVQPFSPQSKVSSKIDSIKSVFSSASSKKEDNHNVKPIILKTVVKASVIENNIKNNKITINTSSITNKKDETDNCSPDILTTLGSKEKSLLEEISETLEKNKTMKEPVLVQGKDTKTVTQTPSPAASPVVKSPPASPAISITAAVVKTTPAAHMTTLEKKKDTIIDKSEISNPILIKTSMDTKRTITRTIPIKKDSSKPKISVFPKQSESDSNSNCSDLDNGISDYYDVVEINSSNYENIPDGFDSSKNIVDINKNETISASTSAAGATVTSVTTTTMTATATDLNETNSCNGNNKIHVEIKNNKNASGNNVSNKKSFFSSQFISDMFLSNKPVNDHLRKRSEIYDLRDNSYITSKITSDGLIVTKNCSDDPLDSTGSSFDSSSDEEMSSINRSESDSGIGICVTSDYKSADNDGRISDFSSYDLMKKSESKQLTKTKAKVSVSGSSSDYEDIQVTNDKIVVTNEDIMKSFDLADKSRELAGEPDGRSDPDGSAEAPALPSSPPPIIDPRPSFLHGVQKTAEKPKIPVKPTVSIINQFPKSQALAQQQQVIKQLQQVIKSPIDEAVAEKPILAKQDSSDLTKSTKKGRAPNPPPSPLSDLEQRVHDFKNVVESSNNVIMKSIKPIDENDVLNETVSANSNSIKREEFSEARKLLQTQANPKTFAEESASGLYTRNSTAFVKSNSPVVREKDKRERATVNPKFRSLNINANPNGLDKHKPSTPEPAPRRSLSLSQDALNIDMDKKPKKNKFSIKKFLRMGTSSSSHSGSSNGHNKTMDLGKRDIPYGENATINDMNAFEIPQAKPRLVIIHPLDINNTGVEVVNKASDSHSAAAENALKSSSPSVVTGKPPAPPQRFDGTRLQEVNKPARPPPPKSAELRRKQKLGFAVAGGDQYSTMNGNVVQHMAAIAPPLESEKQVNVMHNVYANLGEVRSAIAPRKPERTASMREREAQLEIHKRRMSGISSVHDDGDDCGHLDSASDISTTTTATSNNDPHKENDSFSSSSNVSRTISDASDKSMETKCNNNNNSNNNSNNNHKIIINNHNDVDADMLLASTTSAVAYNENLNNNNHNSSVAAHESGSGARGADGGNTSSFNSSCGGSALENMKTKVNENGSAATVAVAAVDYEKHNGSENNSETIIATPQSSSSSSTCSSSASSSSSSTSSAASGATSATNASASTTSTSTAIGNSNISSVDSFNERKKKIIELETNTIKLSRKVELFEKNIIEQQQIKTKGAAATTCNYLNNDGIKNSVQKMTNTIDSYLKNKMSASETNIFEQVHSSSSSNSAIASSPLGLSSATANNSNSLNINNSKHSSNSNNSVRVNSDIELRNTNQTSYDVLHMRQQRVSLPDNVSPSAMYGGGSQCGSINSRGYNVNNINVNGNINGTNGGNRLNEYTNGNGGSSTQTNEYKRYCSNSLANLPRAISMSYCGSEMGESDIYSPYSFCGSEAGADVAQSDISDNWSPHTTMNRATKTVNRLRMRKGRSVVHKNLEDNYGAVIVANHEALAQVLEQLQQSPAIPIALRPIASCINLHFDDFAIVEGSIGVVVGRRAFHSAIWNNCAPVTLALSADYNQASGVSGELNQLSGAASGALNPITEFCDLVPSNYLPLMPSIQIRMVQATISVLPKLQVDTLQTLGAILKSKTISESSFSSMLNLSLKESQPIHRNHDDSVQSLNKIVDNSMDDLDLLDSPTGTLIKSSSSMNSSSLEEILSREVGFVMLQLINGLKNLQSKGIEEMPLSLSNVILCKEVDNKEAQARLCVLQGFNQDIQEEPMGTLCQCAHIALISLLPQTKLTSILSHILLQERSETLSRTKSVLEFSLWGPSDVSLTGQNRERELALQRWLDLERATVLHGLVRSRVELTVYDECHLMFLVRSSAKIMLEASSVIANYKDNNSN